MAKQQADETRPGGMIDGDGWVVGGVMYVDWLEPGDVIAHHVPGYTPMIYRYERNALRSEYGQVYGKDSVPKPWRLVWRNPSATLKREMEEAADDA